MQRRKFLALLGATALTPLVPPQDLNAASFASIMTAIKKPISLSPTMVMTEGRFGVSMIEMILPQIERDTIELRHVVDVFTSRSDL